jgi:predicted DNA-binding ribbon-helix-helix protein
MVVDIDTRRRQDNLSSAIRLFVLDNLLMQVPGYNGTCTVGDGLVREGAQTHS